MRNDELKEQCTFSIILYVNNEEYEKSIESVFHQNIQEENPIQLILVPAPNYESRELIGDRAKEADRVEVLVLGKCSGIKEAYQNAGSHIKGDYVNYMECGSVYEQNLLTVLKEYMAEQDFPHIFLPKYTSEQTSFNKYIPEKAGVFPFSQYKKTAFAFFSSCFIPGEVEIDFDYSESLEEHYLVRVLLGLIEKYPHLFVLEEEEVLPCLYKRNYNDLYEVYQDHTEILKEFFEVFLTGICEKYHYGDMPLFIQYTALSYLKWCVKRKEAPHIVASLYSEKVFAKHLNAILRYVSDKYIFDSKSFNLSEQLFLAQMKYGEPPKEIETRDDIEFWYGWKKVSSVSKMQIKMDFVEISKSSATFILRESFMNCTPEEIETWMTVNGKKVPVQHLNWPYEVRVFGKKFQRWNTYKAEIPLNRANKEYSIEIFSNYKGKIVKRTSLAFQRYMPIVGQLPKCYYYDPAGYILQYDLSVGVLTIKKGGKLQAFGKELSYLCSLICSKDPFRRKAFFSRILYRFLKLFKRKPIWLISDRTTRGDDNGEAFLKYLNSISCKTAKYYFVIDKKTEEGKRIGKIAKTITPNSKKHKLYHLLSDYVISSQANNPVINPLNKAQIYYRDILYSQKFVFLQHGVTKDNQSAWLQKFNRNIYGLVVSTNQEYQSIFDYNYFYEPENVWLTGMPRNDLLYHDEKRCITLMPTWRKNLMSGADPVTGIWMLKEGFQNSEFYKFYNGLMNDKRLLNAAKEYNYSICVKWHPNMEPYADQFETNDQVHILAEDVAYREVFAKTDLLITDYSSVAFDFAYLRKPILYTQFDRDTFFEGGHSYTEGYYNYETDGFGPVTDNLEETVSLIISYMEKGCVLEPIYLERINATFCYSDQNCSKRVYERIVGFGQKR